MSTGRTCDGYGALQQPADIPSRVAPSNGTSRPARVTHDGTPPTEDTSMTIYGCPPDVTSDLKLVIPRKSAAEMRAYRYFLDVAAPAIAGSFDIDLWMREIPQASFADPAVWHAAVSFGSVYEYYTKLAFSGNKPHERNDFALKQFNSSIRYMTASPTTPESKWRALTIAIIFVCICCLECFYDEARMHYKYGMRLLREIEAEMDHGSEDAKSDTKSSSPDKEETEGGSSSAESSIVQRKPTFQSPISLASLRRILCCFELREATLFNGGVIEMPDIQEDQDLRRAWFSYSPPPSHAGKRSTMENITHANKAAQSLLSGYLMFSQENAAQLAPVFSDPSQEIVDSLVAKLEPLFQCFLDLDGALRNFQDTFGSGSEDKNFSGRKLLERKQTRLALLSLRISHEMNRFVLSLYPNWLKSGTQIEERGVNLSEASCSRVLDLADETEALQSELRTWGVPVPPIAIISVPLAYVSMISQKWAERQRALAVLKRPRLEGLLEHSMTSTLTETVMARELELAEQVAQSSGKKSAIEIMEGEFNPMCRVGKTKMEFIGPGRQAVIEMQTWFEVANSTPGKRVLIQW